MLTEPVGTRTMAEQVRRRLSANVWSTSIVYILLVYANAGIQEITMVFCLSKDSPARAWLTIVAGVCIHFSLGGVYTVGNLIPYVTSYVRQRSWPASLLMTEATWLGAAVIVMLGATMFLGGYIMKAVGPNLTVLIGGIIMSAGVFFSYFTIKWSFVGLVLTFGVVQGFGVSLAYATPIACGIRWLPHKKGLVSGVIVAGFGGGAFIFTQVQTAFINASNEPPDLPSEAPLYFSQKDILHRVPYVFLVQGGCYLFCLLVGALLISVPVDKDNETKPLVHDESKLDKPATFYNKDMDGDLELQKLAEKEAKEPSSFDSAYGEVRPRELLRNKYFYFLWLMFFLNALGMSVAISQYKAFALTYMRDDRFLAWVGSVACIFNGAGRVVWGLLGDRFTFRVAMMWQCAAMVILTMTWLTAKLTPGGHKPITFIWVCLMFFMFAGNYALFPLATSATFGQRYFLVNYGLVFTSQTLGAPVGSILITELTPRIGWAGLFSVVSACTTIAGILAFFYRAKKANGQYV